MQTALCGVVGTTPDSPPISAPRSRPRSSAQEIAPRALPLWGDRSPEAVLIPRRRPWTLRARLIEPHSSRRGGCHVRRGLSVGSRRSGRIGLIFGTDHNPKTPAWFAWRRRTPCAFQNVSLMSAPNRAQIQLLEAETRRPASERHRPMRRENTAPKGHRLLRRLYPLKCEVWVPVESTPMQGLTRNERGLQCVRHS
jgi:hypothetical protein